jgi:polysaccharide export outer membrane protein
MLMRVLLKTAVVMLVVTILTPVALLADGSKLAIGDVVAVVVDGEKEFTKAYQIDKDGCVALPMVEPVKVVGLNTSDASAVITKALTKVLVNPQVTVGFVERAKMQVFVVGQVKAPGLVVVGVGDRVVQALAQAGYDDTADLSHISIRRGNEAIDLDLTKYLKGEDLSVNMELQSGDTIVVPQLDMVGTVLVLGQVNKVGTVPLRRGMTFREAMGLIGGVTVEANTEKITLKREGAPDPIQIDYTRAMDGDPSADVALQPGDSIYVPQIETAFFTVMGAVNRPGQYPLKGKLTLSEAIGLAGGPVPDGADLQKVSIMRGAANGRPSQTTNVDLSKVIATASEEPDIQRGDVIYVKDRKHRPNMLQLLQTILPLAWLLR